MSIESAKNFIEKMKTDEDFAKKVNECKNPDERMEVVKDAGFTFTPEDIKQVYGDLSEEELDKVAGGRSWFPKDFFNQMCSEGRWIYF